MRHSHFSMMTLCSLFLLTLSSPLQLHAGGYIFARNNGVDAITHTHGYTGGGGDLVVTVAIDPNSAHRLEMITAVRNVISVLNAQESTTQNIFLSGNNNIPSGQVDFESVLLHEMGHAMGLAHTNQGAEVASPFRDHTNVAPGSNGTFDFDAGTDGVIGSADDERGDDVNLIWFRLSDNNPFNIGDPVDQSTYSRDVGSIPNGGLFPNQANRDVAELLLGSDSTESIMNQGTFVDEAQRTMVADDVATLRLALAGLDRDQGTADDHSYLLQFIGFAERESPGSGPDIVIDFDDSQTGFAVAISDGLGLQGDPLSFGLNGSSVFFNDGTDWFFNETFTTTDCWTVFIIDQPTGADLCAGGTTTLSVNASVTDPSYQWLKDGQAVEGATSATLTLSDVSVSDAGSYTCRISNACDSLDSDVAIVSVGGGITSQPQSQSACSGDIANFTVAAADEAATFQWRKDGVDIPGATAATLTINPVAASDAADYTCVVNDGCGSTTSSAATLTVAPTPQITGQPADRAACEGESVTFSVTVADNTGISYQWRLNGSPISGATASDLTLNPVSATDAGGYDCLVTNSCGTVNSTAANLAVSSQPVISDQPDSVAACTGETVNFTVAANGPVSSFQWRKDGVDIPGATQATLTLNSVSSGDAAAYACLLDDGGCTTLSDAALLTIGDGVSITGQPADTSTCLGADITLEVVVSGDALGFQWRLDGLDIAGASSAALSINGVTATDVGEYTCAITTNCGIVVSDGATVSVLSPSYDEANLPLWLDSVGDGNCLDANGDSSIDIRDFVASVNALP